MPADIGIETKRGINKIRSFPYPVRLRKGIFIWHNNNQTIDCLLCKSYGEVIPNLKMPSRD